MLEEATHATLVVDEAERVVAGNDAAAVMFGRQVGELTGSTLDELVADGVLAPDAVAAYREAEDGGRESSSSSFQSPVVPSSAPSTSSYRVTLDSGADGRTVWRLTDAGESRDESETVTALHAATRELIRADSRMAAFETCADAASRVLGFPATGVREYDEASNELEHVAFGGTVNEVDDRPSVSLEGTPHGEAFRTGETVVHEVDDDDSLYDEDVFSHTMYVPLETFGVLTTGTFGSAFDETDVRLAEVLAANTVAALRQLDTEARLRRQNDRLTEFASVVAHDIRNPLAVATGSLTQYRETGNEEFAERAATALDRMDGIVDDVLALARGSDIEDPVPVSVGDAAREAWATTQTADATLRVDADCTLRGDRGRLLRAFENLFRNAVEHGDAGEVTVTDTDRGVAVCDDGSGFPADVVADATEAGVTTSANGSGLGLAIVADVARAHEMAVTVGESEAGGARVELVERP